MRTLAAVEQCSAKIHPALSGTAMAGGNCSGHGTVKDSNGNNNNDNNKRKATQGGVEPPQSVLVKHVQPFRANSSQRRRLIQVATGSLLWMVVFWQSGWLPEPRDRRRADRIKAEICM